MCAYEGLDDMYSHVAMETCAGMSCWNICSCVLLTKPWCVRCVRWVCEVCEDVEWCEDVGGEGDLGDDEGPSGVVSQLGHIGQGDLDVPMGHAGPWAGGPVDGTLWFALLLHVGQHHNGVGVGLPHHLPEVSHCVWKWAWGGGEGGREREGRKGRREGEGGRGGRKRRERREGREGEERGEGGKRREGREGRGERGGREEERGEGGKRREGREGRGEREMRLNTRKCWVTCTLSCYVDILGQVTLRRGVKG